MSSEQAIEQWTDMSIAQSESDPELLAEGITRTNVFETILEIFNSVIMLHRTITPEDGSCTLQQIGVPEDAFQGIIDSIADGFEIPLENITPNSTLNELVDEVFRLIFQ